MNLVMDAVLIVFLLLLFLCFIYVVKPILKLAFWVVLAIALAVGLYFVGVNLK